MFLPHTLGKKLIILECKNSRINPCKKLNPCISKKAYFFFLKKTPFLKQMVEFGIWKYGSSVFLENNFLSIHDTSLVKNGCLGDP